MKKKNINWGSFILILITFLSACELNDHIPQSNTLSFPVGRSFLKNGEFKIFVGSHLYNAPIVSDSSGGHWITVARYDIMNGEKVKIKFTQRKGLIQTFQEENDQEKDWTEASLYIDSDHEAIQSKANALAGGLNSHREIAQKIHNYVVDNIEFNGQKQYSFFVKASQTLTEKEATCMNRSRLFVALCRAANVPARSIWGLIDGDHHHQWAEYRDESGLWHACDLDHYFHFDLTDFHYLDLIYAAEENDFILNRDTTEIMLHTLKYYNNCPVAPGSLGFIPRSIHNQDSMVLEYTFDPENLQFPN